MPGFNTSMGRQSASRRVATCGSSFYPFVPVRAEGLTLRVWVAGCKGSPAALWMGLQLKPEEWATVECGDGR